MEEIYLDIRNWNRWINERFPDKDFITLDELLSDYEELIYDKEHLEEEIEEIKQDMEDNYTPIPYAEQVEISDRDFI